MFLISSCSRGEILTAGNGHSETWSGERSQVSSSPEGKTLAVDAECGFRFLESKATVAWSLSRSEVKG